MIRYFLVATTVIGFLILSIPLLLLEWVVGKFNPSLKDKTSLAIVCSVFRVCLFFSGVKITVIGEENVPKDRSVLYVSNHRSNFDILLTYVRVPRPTGYIAKLEMKHYPILSNWMHNLHCFFLDRSNMKEGGKMILSSVRKIKEGISICIFPEGTRSKEPDQFLPFHAGSFKIAERAKCPIIPICINNASAMFEDQFPRIKKAHVVIEYGAPIHLEELDADARKHIGTHVQGIIEDMYSKNKALV